VLVGKGMPDDSKVGELIAGQALLIADALPTDYCRELMELWKIGGNVESDFLVEKDGKRSAAINYDRKIRRDHLIEPGAPCHGKICDYLTRQIVGQIKKAFDVECKRVERIKIACYSPGGYFRPHRDNQSPATAHRQFAVSLLLNDDYEGGCLRFPEFGMGLYRANAGAAIVFRCSLLHEVTNVTAGQRFVVLTFLYT
jgi:predicted 2-oxoglutarate/Fe(II)-dependent dioxygenase YbiX